MELIELTRHDAPAVKDVVLIEGLPGVGNVGKLAADHLVDHLEAKPWIDIASHDFPPQVNVQDDGTVDLVGCRLWVAPGARKGGDMVMMTGDYQPMTLEGQYASSRRSWKNCTTSAARNSTPWVGMPPARRTTMAASSAPPPTPRLSNVSRNMAWNSAPRSRVAAS